MIKYMLGDKPITQAEYDALPEFEKIRGVTAFSVGPEGMKGQGNWGLAAANPNTDWGSQLLALGRSLGEAPPPPTATRVPTPVSPFAPAPITTPAPSPFAPAPTAFAAAPVTAPATPQGQPQTWQEILDSWMQKLGGAKTTTTAPFAQAQPSTPMSEIEKGIRAWTSVNGLVAGQPGYEEAVRVAVGVFTGGGQGGGGLRAANGDDFTNPNQVPTTPLPRGYQWTLETKAGSAEYSYTDPVTLQTRTAPAVPTTYRWVPQWVGSGEMDDYQKATLAFNEAKANADRSQELLIAAVNQGNAERAFEAKQQLDAANLELDRATSALNQAKFAQSQTEFAQGQANWEKTFTSTEQKKAFDQLVKMADMAANPRDFVKLWLLQGNDWYKDIVSQVLNKTSNLTIAPPSLAGWNQMSPSAKEGFASVISSQGIPPEDYMSTVARTLWPQKAGPTSVRYSPFVQR